MNRFDHQWQKLAALARQAPADPDTALPPGFATRVAARAVASSPASGPWFALERFAFRGFIAAAACGVAAVAYGFPSLTTDSIDLYATGTADTVVELLDLS
jgi:hypothetical protein